MPAGPGVQDIVREEKPVTDELKAPGDLLPTQGPQAEEDAQHEAGDPADDEKRGGGGSPHHGQKQQGEQRQRRRGGRRPLSPGEERVQEGEEQVEQPDGLQILIRLLM